MSPTAGVVGMVDDLFVIGSEHDLRIEWRDGACHVRLREPSSEATVEVPLPKSVFRAALARISVLCNERFPNTVSSYGGSGKLLAPGSTDVELRVAFSNTPTAQKVELSRGERI
jgi:hypothetical protein